MVQPIVNAAPMTIFLGTQDESTQPLVPVPEALPTHLPFIYTYAQTGPDTPQLVVGDSLTQMYGTNSFSETSPYCTHATPLINAINAQGNQMLIQRVIPTDAAPVANVRLYLDVLATSVPNYARNSDGSYTLDVNGDPVVGTPATVPGFSVMWVTAYIPAAEDGSSNVGAGTIVVGSQTNSTTMTQSQRYPIMDFAFPFQGAAGNLTGVTLYAPTETSTSPINSSMLTNDQVYPFRLQLLQKSSPTATAQVVPTQEAVQYIDFCVQPGVIDVATTEQLYLPTIFPSAYQDLNDPSGTPPVYGPIGAFTLYQANIDTLLAEFYAAEVPYINAFSDFTETTGQMYLFNFLSGVSSQNVPYTSFIVQTTPSAATRLTQNSVFYLSGGTDGTMNNTNFAQLVSTQVVDWADPTNPLQDMALYPASIMYDSGFPLATKYDLISFIAERVDTAVVLSPFDVLGEQLTAAEESSLAVALLTRLQQYPESDYFGTATMRGVIIGRSGTLLNSQYPGPLPLTIEFASKCASYMGASNGVWKPGLGFDASPANQVQLFADVNVTWTPASVRNQDWDNGLVWVEQYDRRTLYWPAFKTVYDNDTSVLTSFFTMMACIQLEKVGDLARRTYSGNTQLTNAQLVANINQFVVDETNQVFDGRFVIIPNTYFTAADTQRGYSWTLDIDIYANNMKTVQTLQITAYRMSSLPTTTNPATTAS